MDQAMLGLVWMKQVVFFNVGAYGEWAMARALKPGATSGY